MLQKFLIDKSVENPERKQHELGKLQSMVDYCHTPDCLRKYIISYFGETDVPDNCANCINCNNDSELVDITVDAQKVFSCIYRLRERFGITMIAEVLKGSKNKRILQFGFDKQSTYGLFSNRSINDIKALIQRLTATQYLTLTESEFPVLKLTTLAYEVLKSNTTVWQKVVKVHKEEIKADTELFEILRKLRRTLAETEQIPPYQIFADSTLRDMCTKLPTTLNEMRKVTGIGEVKLEKYGKIFLDKILETNPKPQKVTNTSSSDKVPTHLITLEYYNQGLSIDEIAQKRNLTVTTIETHIFKACQENLTLDLDRLIPTEYEAKIIDTIKKLGPSPLRPLKDALPPTISYAAIRAVIYKHELK